MKRTKTSLTLKPELLQRLRAASAADRRSLSSWVERALEATLDALGDVDGERARMVPRVVEADIVDPRPLRGRLLRTE